MKMKVTFSSRPLAKGGGARSFAVPLAVLMASMAACGADDRPQRSASGGSGNAAQTGGRVSAPEGGGPVTDGGAGAGGAAASIGGAGAPGVAGSNGGAGRNGGAGSSSAESGGHAGQPENSAGTAGAAAGAGGASGTMTGAAGRTGEPNAGAGGVPGGEPEVPLLNGCSAYVDRRAAAASRTLVWDASIAVSAERCMKIRAGQQVVFDGDFEAHPLEALGGDVPSPFSSASWVFAEPGVFGYICTIHAEMTGAIWVVP